MKWKILISLLFINYLFGQIGKYFPDTNTVWRVAIWQSKCFASPTFPGVYDYIMQGDTIINGIKYKKLYRKIVQLGTAPVYNPNKLEGYLGAIRQYVPVDSSALIRVVFRPENSPHEYVIAELLKDNKSIIKNIFRHNYYNYYKCYYYYQKYLYDIATTNSFDTINIFGKARRVYKNLKLQKLVNEKYSDRIEINIGDYIEGVGFTTSPLDKAYPGIWENWKVIDSITTPITHCYNGENRIINAKLLCFMQDTLKHEFVPNGCKTFKISRSYSNNNFTHFPGKGAKWRVRLNKNTIYEYLLTEDTIINNKKYTKVIRKLLAGNDTPIFRKEITTGYIGAIREDSTKLIVYFLPKDSINEEILYDFSINTENVFYNSYFTNICNDMTTYDCRAWIKKIDTLHIFGKNRKVILLENRYSNNTNSSTLGYNYFYRTTFIIEGLGNIANPFDFNSELSLYTVFYKNTCYGYPPFPPYPPYPSDPIFESRKRCGTLTLYEFICFEYNGEKITNSFLCDTIPDNIKNLSSKIKIINKPNFIIITSENYKILKIKIYNSVGQEIKLPSYKEKDKYIINTTYLPTGVYFIKILTSKEIITRKLLIFTQ